jgi:hypothetical protein
MSILAVIARCFFRFWTKIKSQKEVEAFYQDIKTPFMLRQKISQHGFQWKGENFWLDWNKTPAESLAAKNKKINCGDFLNLYIWFFHKHNIFYKVYLLENLKAKWSYKYDWHYVSIFSYYDQTWLQSNNDLIPIDNEDKILEITKYDKITRVV